MAEFQLQTQTHPSDPSQFSDLDTQTQRGSYRMLSAAAGIYATAYALAYLTDWGILIGKTGHFVFPPMIDNILSSVAIAYAIFVAVTIRNSTCTACRFTRMALSFMVVASLGISAHAWYWELDPHAGGVSWVGVWIVAFAGTVTLTPRVLLLGGLLSWATLVVIALASLLVHGVPANFPGSPMSVIVQVALPVLICVFIAWAISLKAFKMARDVSKARRLGSYQLSERIGAGGMGEVWRAKHRLLARPAAVKLIRPESLTPTGDNSDARAMLKRFEREAQVTALLTSPHSVALYDFGIAEDGVFYYVMELLEGRDLKTLVRESGPVSVERAVHFLREACDSLADAHDRGLIHRDIKPANIFTCRRGREFDFVKVLDFGLVKNVREREESITQLTGAGTTSGTPGFMAPEMITGETKIDARTDIYALGCVAYWLLTGQMVFEGTTPMSVLIQHVKEEPAPLSSRTELRIPPRLEEIVHACLAKSPSERPASADELAGMLDAVAAELPAWTRDRAQQWWQKNLPNLYYATARVDTADSGASTVVNV
ncbi:MAG TPA: serine/threonine-protein kinase [Candidatus Krumholzibacteria bacterium]|nr:serine/threonine-protein kinase [Candidatus Krumholzibacteria bacterium]